MNTADRIRLLPCGCHSDALTDVITAYCRGHEPPTSQAEGAGLLQLAVHYADAHLRSQAAELASLEWALAQRSTIGNRYGPRMLTRLRHWFSAGLRDHPRPRVNSNYDRPLIHAYREGQRLRVALVALARRDATSAPPGAV